MASIQVDFQTKLVHPRESQNTKGGSVQEVERKNSRHLNDLDDVLFACLIIIHMAKIYPSQKATLQHHLILILLEIIDVLNERNFFCFFIYSKKTRSKFLYKFINVLRARILRESKVLNTNKWRI